MTLGVGVDHVIDAACSSQAVRSLDDETGEVLLTADAVPGVADPDHQVRDLPDLAQHPGARARRAVPPDPGPRGPGRVRRARRGPARESRPVLGPRRRAAADPAQSGAAAAGGPVESLPDRAGVLAGRRGRSPGEGADRAGLRGPLLLGYRGLRPAVPVLHPAQDRPEPAAVPAQHARPRAGAGGPDEPARGAVPVADHQRRGGLVQFPAGHRPVSHQRRYRLCGHALRPRGGQRTRARRDRRGNPRRDRPAVGRTSASTAPTSGSTSTA